MQNRYAGDIGDYIKIALLRAISPGSSLGVAWYLYPDEGHNNDGRHVDYLRHPENWRHFDPELFDKLSETVREQRSVAALEAIGVLPGARFAREPILSGNAPPRERSRLRSEWFSRRMGLLEACDIVFADPDNGLIDDGPDRRRGRKFGKQMPLSEALALSEGRIAVIYHHNTRFPGGHDLEVEWWRNQLGCRAIAVRANAFSCRTFFVLNPDRDVRERVAKFCRSWSARQVRFHG